MTRGLLQIATRGSELALRQATVVREALEARRYDVDIVEVETRGDRLDDALIRDLGRTGAFVRSLDRKVLAGDVDAAVHSMKDMPTEFPDRLRVAAVPDRAPAGDILVTPDGGGVSGLPDGATVGTSSLRRRAQLLAERPDLKIEPLRGNVDTRIEKLLAPSLQRDHQRRLRDADSDEMADDSEGSDTAQRTEYERTPEQWFDDLTEIERRALERNPDQEYDAIVLAEAGLRRGGLFRQVNTARLSREAYVPAPGQGALAVTTATEEATAAIRTALDHPPTRVTTTAERTVLAAVGGGCVAPIGVHALLQGAHVRVRARVLATDGNEEVSASRDLPVERHVHAAEDFGADLREKGAVGLIDAARRENADRGTRHD